MVCADMNSTCTPSRRLVSSLAFALFLALVALVSCSSRSSGAPAFGTAVDLQGFWKIWTTEPGQAEMGPAALFLTVSGSDISGADLSGTINGSKFEFKASVLENGTTAVVGTLTTAITGGGTYTVAKPNGSTVTGTFRMLKFLPTGEFTIKGSVLGTPISHTSKMAIGSRKYSDAARTQLNEVEILTGSASLDFEMDIDPTNFTIGTLVAGTGSKDVVVALELSNGTVSIRPTAIGGSITVTKYDPTGLSAIFNLRLNTGDTVTGSMNVRFDIEAFTPPGP
jgi:hypothetical protein